MPVTLTGRVCDEADLKLKEIELRMRQVDPTIRRPQAIEMAILVAKADTCVRELRRRKA